MDDMYNLTSGEISRRVGCAQQYISCLAAEGLLKFVTTNNGHRLFSDAAVEEARKIRAQRLLNRGWKSV